MTADANLAATHARAWAPDLSGHVALVTGAGRFRSIGRQVALEMARQGVDVVLTGTGRDPSTYPAEEREMGWADIQSVADECTALGVRALPLVSSASDPVAVASMVEQVIDRFGRIDILVNNAGAARGEDRQAIVDVSYDQWSHVIAVNLHGTFLTSQAVAREMLRCGRGGSITNISSIASRLCAPQNGAYSVSKIGVNALSRTLAVELAPAGIRVNALLPGIIETSRMDDLGRGEEWQCFVRSNTPLGTAGTGHEIATMCVFLASEKGSWITGQEIAVDGGASWH